jgi:hypothetical protein
LSSAWDPPDVAPTERLVADVITVLHAQR